jgi:hypothetical protein
MVLKLLESFSIKQRSETRFMRPPRQEMPMLSSLTFRRLAVLIFLASSSWLSAQSYDLDRGREPVVSLDGQWRFHTGDSPLAAGSQAPLWAGADFDDSGWAMLSSNKSWSEQGFRQ